MKIFYFSGTGNSYWTAHQIGAVLSADVCAMADFKDKKQVVAEDDVIGIISPTYMNDVPWVVKDFVLKLRAKPDTFIFAVQTSNNGVSGNAFSHIDHALAKNGLTLSAAFDLRMPGNCIPCGKRAEKSRVKKAPKRIADICKSVKSRKKNYDSDHKKAGVFFVQRSMLYNAHSPLKRFKVTDDCTGCSLCAKICPMGNIKIVSGRAVHGKSCASCYACVHWCPKNATKINLPVLKNRKQYHHPKVSADQLMR